MKKNITTGGPSLFPATADAEYFDGIYTELTEKQYLYESDFLYYPHFPAELKQRAKDTFCENVGLLRDALTAKDVEGSTVDAVIKDYATLLCGPCELSATIEQMNAATKAVTPIQAFFIDRYGLFNGVFKQYLLCLSKYDEYRETVQGPNATNETKKGFLDLVLTDLAAKAIYWLIQNKLFVLDDWRGFDITAIGDWIYKNRERAAVGEYVLCYTIAKYLYKATPQELDAINKPKQATQIDFAEYVEDVAERAVKLLQLTADEYAKIATPEQTNEHTKAAQAVKDWHDKTNAKILTLSGNINNALSRNMEFKDLGGGAFPVQQYIEEFNAIPENKKEFGEVSLLSVQKLFEAINLFPSFLKPIILNNGILEYHLSRSELALLAGYLDANQTQKNALVGSAVMCGRLYVLIDRPVRYVETQTLNGRKRKIKLGGRQYVQILNVPNFDADEKKEGLTIDINPDAFKGRNKTLIAFEDYKKMKAHTKGVPQSRFIYQILEKGHKKLDDIVAEIYGYDTELKLAAGDPEKLKKVKTKIQNHNADYRKLVLQIFKTFEDDKIIKFTYVKKTDVCQWERIKPLTFEEQEILKQYFPDEQ